MTTGTLPDGRQLHYREAGAGQPLVLLHGWSMSSAVFQEVMAQLAGDYRVLVPDLAGHGASDPTRSEFSLDALAADLENWLQQLEIDTIDLLGWSLGGQVALQLTRRGHIKVAKLILVSTTPLFVATDGWPHGLPVTQVRAMDRQIQRDYKRSMSEFFTLMFDGEVMDRDRYRRIVQFAVREGSLPEREISRRGLKVLGSSDLRPELATLELPVLVHYGLLDLITDPAACRFLADEIPAAESACWEEVGHAPFLSRPDASVALWREFLQ